MNLEAALHETERSRRHIRFLTIVFLSLASGLMMGSLALPNRGEGPATEPVQTKFQAPSPAG